MAAEQVRVMQWNIHGNLGDIANNTTTEAKAIARIVNYNQPDVLLFNEVEDTGVTAATRALINWVTNNVPYLGTQPGVTFFVAVSSIGDGFERNGAISRHPILNETTYDDGLRGLHAFTVHLATTNLQIFHAHLKCCSDGTSCTRKQTEAQFDADTISAWASANSIPYIFGGDWNEDEENPECTLSATYHPITTIRQDGGLAEFKPTTLSGEYRTWSTASTPSIRFDYLLAANGRLATASGYVFSTMDWATYGLYTNASAQNLVDDSATASDHYCVVAEYSFGTAGPSLAVSPAAGLESTGGSGGPFDPSTQVYTLTNAGPGSLNWTAAKSANWLTVSATNGTLAAGASTNLTVSINASADSLPVGDYSDTISFDNTSSGAGSTTRSASLTVTNTTPPPPFGFYDDFSTFANGYLVGQSDWAQAGTRSSQPLQVSGGTVSIPGGQTSDTQDGFKNFTQTNITLFYGLTLTVTSAVNSTSASYFTALWTGNDATGYANYRLTAKAGDASLTDFVLGVRVTGQSGDPYTFGTTTLTLGVQYRVIVQAPAGYDSALLYVNPTSPDLGSQIPYASNPIGTGTTPTSLGSIVISQYGTASVPTDGISIGKVVVSDSFATVYNALAGDPFQSWQVFYFGSTTNPAAAPTADPDNDGMNNHAEFQAGTIPTNSASALRITGVAREGNALRVTWTMGNGKTNVLQEADHVDGTDSFTDAFTVLTVGSVTNYLDVGAATNARFRFYRVRLAP